MNAKERNELRNILVAVEGYAYLLSRAHAKHKKREYLFKLWDMVQEMQYMTGDRQR